MQAEIVSVGTELLMGEIVDTHAATMGRILADCGINCIRRSTVGDNLKRIAQAIREGLRRSDIVITIGGLGPTEDDVTRDAVAVVFDVGLSKDSHLEQRLKLYFEERSIPWMVSIARQAEIPDGGRYIENLHGTAPGLIVENGGKVVISLPGPKGEFEPMAHGAVREFLASRSSSVIAKRIVRIVGLPESVIEERCRDLIHGTFPSVAPYAKSGEVHLRVAARAPTRQQAEAAISPVIEEISKRLGTAVFGFDDESLEAGLISMLAERRLTVATAESVTGGELAARLSATPGASHAFKGGIVAYTAGAKINVLSVTESALAAHGPVSEQVALEMATKVRLIFSSTFGIATTGNAGPTSDVGGKQIGSVFTAIADERGAACAQHRFRGVREDVRRRASQAALSMLRERLLTGK